MANTARLVARSSLIAGPAPDLVIIEKEIAGAAFL